MPIGISKARGMTFAIDGKDNIKTYENNQEKIYPLRLSDEKEIFQRRRKGIPTFVLKIENELYIAQISEDSYMSTNIDESVYYHLCTNCMFCRALPRKLGGCEKVLDCSVETYLKEGNSFKDALELSKRIEKYTFISLGYETFGAKYDVFGVYNCHFYQKYLKKRQSFGLGQTIKLKESIERFYHNG